MLLYFCVVDDDVMDSCICWQHCYFCVVDDDLDEEGIMDEEEGDEEDFEGEEDVSL